MPNGGKTMKGKIEQIDYETAINFLLPKHYSGRKPVISKAFGWYLEGKLKAVCTFGKPASPFFVQRYLRRRLRT